MFKGKTIILSPCKNKKPNMERIRMVPVDLKHREKMRKSSHKLNVWVKTGPNMECNHYLQKCRPIMRRIATSPMMMKKIVVKPSYRRRGIVSPICVTKTSAMKRLRKRTRRRTRARVIKRSVRRRSTRRRRSKRKSPTKRRRSSKRKSPTKRRRSSKRKSPTKRRRSRSTKRVNKCVTEMEKCLHD
jgi:hypothetical protein